MAANKTLPNGWSAKNSKTELLPDLEPPKLKAANAVSAPIMA